ncbi:MAG: acyl-CoA thioesterase [Desulfobacterales bacterium]|nr:acyl-CoA thioesterase [Desulfobacterales bacterium]
MNLYLRLFWLFLTARFKPPLAIMEEFRSHHRVWPNDLDLLGHMNNGRFFTITDLVRIEVFIRTGIWGALKKRGLYPVMAGETVQFRRPLTPFKRYTIVTRNRGWSDKFFYVEHRFESTQGVHALMLVKACVIGPGRVRLSPAEVFGFAHEGPIAAQKKDDLIDTWDQSTRIHWCRDGDRPGNAARTLPRAA